MEAPDEIAEALRRFFGHADFRAGQRGPVEAVLSGRDAVVVMPTGSGKSICYQLAAMLLPGTTLVVSPLIALMKDQVDALARRGVPAAFLNSSLSASEMDERMAAFEAGRYKLVYVAPERLRSSSRSTRRTASASGATTSAPTTSRSARSSRGSAPACA